MAAAASLDWLLRPSPVARRYNTKTTSTAPAQNHQRRVIARSGVVRPSAWVKRAVVGRSASVMEVSEFIASSQSSLPHHHIDDPEAGMISTGAKLRISRAHIATHPVPTINRREQWR